MADWAIVIIVSLLIILAACIFYIRSYYVNLLHKEVVRARRSEHIKTVFLANVSHSLRGPLNSIITKSDDMITTGIEDTNPETVLANVKQMNADGKQLLYFISQLLELSNFESGMETFTFIEVNLAELMASYRREAQRDVLPTVSVSVHSTLSPHCKATLDTNLMYQLMMHLLQNAIRHTKEGVISIEYEAERDGLQVTITDTGDGLPQKFQNSISDMLNGQDTINLFSQSSGLGLSICKAIVDGLEGEISLTSDHGKGTKVIVYLPCRLRDKHKGI